MANSGCTGCYLDSLTKIVHTRDPSENPINVKLPYSSTMASTHQAQISLQNLSIQAKHAENFPNLQSSLILTGQLCHYELIVAFDKPKVIASKNKDKIIGGYRDPTNGLWRLPLRRLSQNNRNPIFWNRSQANTGTNTLNQWRRSTPEHISQHPSKT